MSWTVIIRSNEKRDDGIRYIIVDLSGNKQKVSREYKIDDPSKNLDWLKRKLRAEIDSMTIDSSIKDLALGNLDLTLPEDSE